MKTISAAEANRQFSRIMREVGEGETFLVTSRGKPVLRMVPAGEPSLQGEQTAREKAKAVLMDRLRTQPILNTPITWTRDDLYDDDF